MSKNSKIRVFLADDHPLFRTGLRMSFNESSDIEIAGEAENSFVAVEKIKKVAPEVVLMDVDMPGLSGIAAIRMLHSVISDLKILVLSTYNDSNYIQQAMRAGAAGYVLKSVDIGELKEIIKAVHEERPIMSPYLVNLSLEIEPEPVKSSVSLTRREEDVLRFIATGMGNKEIAAEAFVSVETIKSHVRNIYKKLDVKNRIEATRAALQMGLIND